jgi:predicted nuclease of predicted toxin-antitoxin system
MKLLLDQGLPRSAAVLLTRAGHDTVHVGDIGLGEADDGVSRCVPPALLR